VILSLVGWTTLGREVRGRFLPLREEDFVLAARLAGCSRMRIILRHMVPTFTSHIIATSSLAIPVMIINETSLSFLGPGHPPARHQLGRAACRRRRTSRPWRSRPGCSSPAWSSSSRCSPSTWWGDGLRDAADPYSH
jgi:peptide/nickel transport system permease protein